MERFNSFTLAENTNETPSRADPAQHTQVNESISDGPFTPLHSSNFVATKTESRLKDSQRSDIRGASENHPVVILKGANQL